ncbi:MAG: polysaccharide deacetylase family protein [Bacillota bacterium]
MEQTRRDRKAPRQRRRWGLARLMVVITLVLVAGISAAVFLVRLPPLLRPDIPAPDLPRLLPPLPPLDGGTEGGNRPDVPSTLAPEVVLRGPGTRRAVAITFDDGPDPVSTPQVLETLGREGVVATFFLVGNRAELYPHLVRDIAARGHEIGNHTFSHPRLDQMTRPEVQAEILQTSRVLEQTARMPVRWFRPPYGRFDETVLDVAHRAGLRTALWSVDSRDWDGRPASSIQARVAAGIQPGAIILLHCAGGATEDFWQTVVALPSIIAFLKANGYRMVTLTELMRG